MHCWCSATVQRPHLPVDGVDVHDGDGDDDADPVADEDVDADLDRILWHSFQRCRRRRLDIHRCRLCICNIKNRRTF